MKKLIYTLFLCFSFFPLFAQTNSVLTDENASREISALFMQAHQAQLQEQTINLFKQNPLNKKTFTLYTNLSPVNQSVFFAGENSPQTAPRKWQLALILAADNHQIAETLNELRGQIQTGTLAQAVLLDITRLPEGDTRQVKANVKGKMKGKQKEKNGKESSRAGLEHGNFYFLFAQNGTVKTEKREISVNTSSQQIFNTVVDNLNKNTTRYYTGLYVHAHSNGFDLDTNTSDYLSVQDIVFSLADKKIKVDFLGLAACHTSSLQSVFTLSLSSQIKYLASSSDGEYAPRTFYRFLRFLNQAPREFAFSFVDTWRKEIQWNPTAYNSTNMNVLELATLKNALTRYVALYDKLQSYQGAASQAIQQKFRQFFGNYYYDWKSLAVQIQKQRDYIASRLTQDRNAASLLTSEKNFIAACDTLLNALQQATLKHWCYSKPHNQVYTDVYPQNSGCLQSVNVTADQYYALTDFSASY